MDTNAPRTPLAVLERLLEQAKANELADVVVVFETKDGGTDVRSSAMSIIQANHLCSVYQDRVRTMYAQVRRRAEAARSPTAGVSANGPKAEAVVKDAKAAVARVAPQLPRKQRRLIAKAVAKATRKAARTAPGPKPPAAPAGNSH